MHIAISADVYAMGAVPTVRLLGSNISTAAVKSLSEIGGRAAEDGANEEAVKANGSLTEKTAVEFEKENKNGKAETEYELKFLNGEGKGKYSVEREVKNNVTEIKVKYDINGKTGEFRIREISDGNGKRYEYYFKDGSKLVFDR